MKRDKAERRRQRAAERSLDDVPAPPSLADGRRITGSTVWSFAVGAFGMLCMLASLVLAVGALLLALGNDDGDVYSLVSSVCDALIGPLRDLVEFSGANAEAKQTLVAWGVGALIYLVVGIVAQLYQRTLADD